VVAQAKVNLALRILAREAGGYHQLETVFQRLELGDVVTVRTGVSGRSIDCRGADVGPPERNLAWRAAVAFAERAGWPDGFAIDVEKRIPVGGGLGGGSADAGAVLRALNALAPRPLTAADLLALATPLGADVPFLTTTAPLALAWGRGERLLALPALPPRDVYLWTSAEGVSTADAYGWLAASRGAYAPAARLWSAEDFASWDRVAREAENDFEQVVPQRHAGIGTRLGTLRIVQRDLEDRGFALLAGSGATVYAVTDGRVPLEPPAAALGGAVVRTRTATRVAAVARHD
jgi:4-diphosphocytidyl-2-C-methyl-D-erythritol kinase